MDSCLPKGQRDDRALDGGLAMHGKAEGKLPRHNGKADKKEQTGREIR